jgi:hypothetical protein
VSEVTKKKSGIYTVTEMLFRKAAIKFTLKIAALLIAIITSASLARAAAPANEWWDSNYQYRYKISVTAGTTNVPTDYSVRIEFDHAALVAATKSLSSGDDIRIAHWNGSTWTELDRRLDDQSSWDSATTQVWFRTQAGINATETDNNYYMYYGYSSASSPPANKSNVYVFWDDFESGDLSNWTVQVDAVWSAASDQANSGTYSLKASGYTSGEDKWITANGINESDLLMEAYWRFNDVSGLDAAQGFRSSSSLPIDHYETNLEGVEGWNIAKMITNWSEIEPNPGGQNPQNNVWTKITTIIVGTNMQVLRNDTQLVPSSGWTDVGSELSSGTVGFRAYEIGSGDAWWIDDVKVRKYVSPEPTNFIGGEESNATFIYRSVGTNGGPLASGGPRASRVFDEQYENTESPGYDESITYETGSPNENKATSGVTGAPSEWGDECLEIVHTGTNLWAEGDFNGSHEKSFLRLEFIIDSESISAGGSNQILEVEDSSWNSVYALQIIKTGGVLKAQLVSRYDGNWHSFNSFAELSLDTRYRVEVKWDSTAGVDEWSWKLDGVVQPNNQDSTYPVTTEGTLETGHRPNVEHPFVGTMWTLSGNMTTYFDLFALDDSDWVGPANGLTVSGSTATFDIDLDNQIGVGDVIQYDSDGNGSIDALAFIHGRTESQTYTVKDKDGGTPTAVTSDYDWAIYRAYTSLSNWQSQTENSSITYPTPNDVNPSQDLVTADTIMMVACYGDGPDTTMVIIDDWTTGVNNYIKIYTPYLLSEVGASQRHNGKWDDSKYRIESGVAPIRIGANSAGAGNVWIDGLQVNLSSVTGNGNSGILSNQTTQANHRISNNIIRSVTNNSYSYTGIYLYAAAASSEARIWNNIVYGFDGTSGSGISNSDTDYTAYVYNNTVYDCSVGYGTSGTSIAKNNIAYNNTNNYSGTFDAASTNNLSGPSQTDAPGSNPSNAVTVNFVDPAGSPPDLHLESSDTGARDNGTPLSGDTNLAFTDDIDGGTRSGTWDIGADEIAGLIGHWKFDEGTGTTAADSAGTNHGTLEGPNPVGLPAWTCVSGGYALTFDGVDDEVDLYNEIIGNRAAWTVTAWIKMGADSADQRTIYSEGDTSANEYWILYVGDSENFVKFWSPNGSAYMQGTTNVEDGAWHLVTLVQRSKTDRELYVGTLSQDTDNTDMGTLTYDAAAIGTLKYIYGGVGDYDPVDPFLGTIDAVRIYDYALSVAEISALAASPPGDCVAGSPSLTVDEPNGTSDTVAVGDPYNIQYDLSDTDDVVTVAFYYDTDNSGYDGTAITGACASGAEGTDVTCSWDTTGMTPGNYYVYGVTNDGTNPEVKVYSSGQITINAAGTATFTQNSFRVRNDNGDETTSTWTAAADTNWTQMVDKNFRVRFLVQETAGIADSDKTLQLEYNLNSGGWNDVTGSSSIVKAASTAYVTDGVDITQQLGSGTLVTPNAGFDEADGLVGGASLDFSGSDEVEVEFNLQIVGTDVSNGDTIQLRVKGLNTYTNTPTVTVTGAGTFLYKKSIAIQSGQVGASCSSTTDTWQVSANSRDAWDDSSSGSINGCGFGDTNYYDAGGYQWTVDIPQGATITSAKVKVYSTSHTGATGAYTARIRVEDVVNASAFTGASDDIYNRTYYGTTVDWNIPAAGLPVGSWSESPDISALVQHIVDNGSWSPGNFLSIAIWGLTSNGGCIEDINDYSDDPTYAAQLEVSYQTGSGSIQDFPVMVELTGTHFQEVENDVDADYHDIIFKAEDDATCGGAGLAPCILDHEIEAYDETNDLLVAWVRVPTLSATADTTIYMYYGNAAVALATQNPTGVWNSSFREVFHLHEPSGTLYDSTANGYTGAAVGSAAQGVNGKISKAVQFDGSVNGHVTLSDGTMARDQTFTFSAWVWANTLNSQWEGIVTKGRDSNDDWHGIWINDSNLLSFGWESTGGPGNLDGSLLSAGQWYYVAATYDGTNRRLYLNNAPDGAPGLTGPHDTDIVENTLIGEDYPNGSALEGLVDEVRISNVARDLCWIQTDHSNQNTPASFYTLGFEQSSSNSPPTLTVNQPDGTGDTVTVGDSYDINYDLADTDDVVTVAFYYDDDDTGENGTAITGACATAAEGTGVTCSWDTTGMTPGAYYVYGTTNDGTNPDVTVYSSGQTTINAAPTPTLNQAHVRWRNDDGSENGGSTTVVYDSFTEAGDTAITSHTPETGTGWTEVYDSSTATTNAQVIASSGIVRAGSDENNVGQAYTAQPAPTGVDQDISITLRALNTDTGTKPVGIFGRRTDNSNFYHVQILSNAHAEPSVKLWKFVSGVATELGSYDATLAVNDVIKLEIRDATKKVYINGIERISSTDNALTNAGTWGIYFGDFNGAGDGAHLRMVWELDDFLAEEPGGSGATWAAIEDTKLTGLAKNTTKRLRFLVDNSGTAASGAVSYELQVAETATCGSGSYTALDSSTHWNIVDSTYITDGAASSNVTGGLTDPGGSSWVDGELEDGEDSSDIITLAANEFTEIEFAIQATSNATTGGDYCFRLYDTTGGSALDAYPVYAQASIEGGAILTQVHYRWRNDDGVELGGLDSGTGADGSVTLSSSQNINTAILGSNRAGNPDGVLAAVTANPTGTSISVSDTTGFGSGDEILLINLMGSSGDTADVGNYEFLEIDTVPNGTTLNLTTAVQKSYDGSSFANQKIVVQRVPQWTNVTINAGGSLTANAWNGTSGGIIVFRATGAVSVAATTSITADGLGYWGGTGGTSGGTPVGGANGESYDGTNGSGGAPNNAGTLGGGAGSANNGASNTTGTRGGGGGGGAEPSNDTTNGGGGGAGGGYAGGGGGGGGSGDGGSASGTGGTGGNTGISAGGGGGASCNGIGGDGGDAGNPGSDGAGTTPGPGGAAGSGSSTGTGGGASPDDTDSGGSGGGGGGLYGDAALTQIFLGSGGGGGGGANEAVTNAPDGGAGGGIIFIIANTVTIDGTLSSDGATGSQGGPDTDPYGASGGGAGGSIMIQANSFTNNSTCTATGGNGGGVDSGAGGSYGAGGGGGGVGRIRIEADTITGTTSPTASTAGTPGGGSPATFAATEDTELTGFSKGSTIRLRFEVSNEGTTSSGLVTYQLQVAETDTCGSGIYTAVPTGSTEHWQIMDSSYINEPEATSNINPGLTDEATTWVDGELKDQGNTTVSITLDADEFTEIEFAIQATSNATDGGDYCFRLYDTTGGSTLDTYTVYAQVSIAASYLDQIHYRWRNDDGGEGGFSTGTGVDGSVTINSSQNINTDVLGSNRSTNADGILTSVSANPTGASISVASTTGFAAGDEILIINMQGASGDTADVGNYEFLIVDSVPDGTTLNLTTAVQKSYDGSNFDCGTTGAAMDRCDHSKRWNAHSQRLGRHQRRHHRLQGDRHCRHPEWRQHQR